MLSMLYLAFLVSKSKLVEENSYSGHLLTALALLATPVRPPWMYVVIEDSTAQHIFCMSFISELFWV